MSDKETFYCKNCKKTMDGSQFYVSKNLEKYPNNGKMDKCKKCLTMHVNSWQPTTFLKILEEVDVPYIETEWNILLERYGKDPRKVTGLTIMGRYLSKMKLTQYSNLTWADTERLAEEEKKKKEIVRAQEEMSRNRYAAAVTGNPADLNLTEEDFMNMSDEELEGFSADNVEATYVTIEDELTAEDKKYLSMKWGKLYRAEEWISLEKFYSEMMDSFDIVGAAHVNYLMMICKTQLKMNQAIDCGDIEGFQKLSKVYDSMMKSSKFTAAQNKAESGEFVDCIGELVYLCEEQGFIPRFHTDEPKDIVDITLKDMKQYSYKLVTEEMGLGNMIESALQQMQREEDKEEDEMDDGEEDLFDVGLEDETDDSDFEDYYNELERQKDEDSLVIEEVK